MGIENLLAQGVQIRPAGMERNALMQAQEFKDRQQRNALMQMQMDDVHAQRQLAIEQAKQVAADRKRVEQFRQSIPSPQMQASQQALAGGGGPTVGNAAQIRPVDPRLQALHGAMQAGMGTPMDYINAANPEAKYETVAPGASRVNSRTNQVVFTAPDKAKMPDGMRMGANGPEWIPGYLEGKGKVAAQGAARLSVNTEKSYGGEIAQGLAKADLAALDVARSAPDRVRSATDVKRILSTGNTITGTAAEQRLWLDKALSTAGVIDGTRTQATEDLVNLLANQTLDAIKTSGLGSGQGFTDKDRQFLQDAKAGRIEINSKTLYRMADLNEKSARAAIAYGNKVAARLKNNPILGTIGQDLEVQAPADLNEAIAAEARRRGLGGK